MTKLAGVLKKHVGQGHGTSLSDVNQHGNKGLAPLHLAAEAGSAEEMKVLLGNGADVNATDGEGMTPLHHVIVNVRSNKTPYAKIRECVAVLLESGGDANVADIEGNAPLSRLLFLMRGYDPWLSDDDVEHLLSTLSLLLRHGADVTSDSAAAGLHHVLDERVDYDAKRMLIAHGADVTAVGGGRGSWSALHKAVRAGNVESVKKLLEAGADVNAPLVPIVGYSPDGDAAIHIAAEFNEDITIAKMLIAHGADLEQRDMYKNTALLKAIFAGSLEHAKLFLEHGADVNVTDATEALPPGLASWEMATGQEDPPSIDDSFSRTLSYSESGTALHHVFSYVYDTAKAAAFVELLLQHGANVNARCLSGETPLGKAVRLATVKDGNISPEVIKLLLDAGADPNVTDYHGNTIMDWAKGYPEVAGLLEKHAAGAGDAG